MNTPTYDDMQQLKRDYYLAEYTKTISAHLSSAVEDLMMLEENEHEEIISLDGEKFKATISKL